MRTLISRSSRLQTTSIGLVSDFLGNTIGLSSCGIVREPRVGSQDAPGVSTASEVRAVEGKCHPLRWLIPVARFYLSPELDSCGSSAEHQPCRPMGARPISRDQGLTCHRAGRMNNPAIHGSISWQVCTIPRWRMAKTSDTRKAHYPAGMTRLARAGRRFTWPQNIQLSKVRAMIHTDLNLAHTATSWTDVSGTGNFSRADPKV